MGFIGAIQSELRSILAEMAPNWRDREVFVGASGNCTVERILWQAGVRCIHGNDVSLYSCALGSHLAGEPIRVGIKDERYAWLAPYLTPGIPTIATLLLCSEAFQHADRPERFHQRMWQAAVKAWPQRHAATITRVEQAIGDLKLASFSPMDVVDFVVRAPRDAVVVTFPPTYRNGYERMYRKIDEVFEWDAPAYQVFDDERFAELIEGIRAHQTWVTLRDGPVPELETNLIGLTQTSLRAKPVYVYASKGPTRIAMPSVKVGGVPMPRLFGEVDGPLRLVRLRSDQFATLRSQYLKPSIIPAGAQLHLGVAVGDKLAGAFAINRPTFGEWCDAYLMSDFAIRPTIYPRLSKLVLVAILSREAQAEIQRIYGRRIERIGTTAFTDKPVSMKYRGVFDLVKRDEGALNYVGQAGRWTLDEAMRWWQKHHGQRSVA